MKYKCISECYVEDSLLMSPGDIVVMEGDQFFNITKGLDYRNIPDTDRLISHMEEFNTTSTVINEDFDLQYKSLERLGLINADCRSTNIGNSNYSQHIIQPWSIWLDWDLNPWDADIIKRVLRSKEEPGVSMKESRISDYEKIIHICQERIRQLNHGIV